MRHGALHYVPNQGCGFQLQDGVNLYRTFEVGLLKVWTQRSPTLYLPFTMQPLYLHLLICR